MKHYLLLSLLGLAFLGGACSRKDAACDCDCEKSETKASAHPLRGVVTGLRPNDSAVLVKHEEIPGVMKAMTMLFKVSAEDLARLRVGDQLTAEMSRRGDDWVLEKINVVPTASP